MRASIGQDHMDFCSSASVSGSLITMLIVATRRESWVRVQGSVYVPESLETVC